jgi:hypothetical protein
MINFDKFEEQIFFNTVLIENLSDGEFGTGFLLQKDLGNGKTKHLLFSNKHVFWGKKSYLDKIILSRVQKKNFKLLFI